MTAAETAIEVLVEVDKAGRFHAYVRQRLHNGAFAKGDDLLKSRPCRNLDAVVVECNRQIQTMFKLIDPPRVVYTYPTERQPAGKKVPHAPE
jgi:hypothetical protein